MRIKRTKLIELSGFVKDLVFFFLIGKNRLLEKFFFLYVSLRTLCSPVTDINTCWCHGSVLLFTFPFWRFLEKSKLKRGKRKRKRWIVMYLGCFGFLCFLRVYIFSWVLHFCRPRIEDKEYVHKLEHGEETQILTCGF